MFAFPIMDQFQCPRVRNGNILYVVISDLHQNYQEAYFSFLSRLFLEEGILSCVGMFYLSEGLDSNPCFIIQDHCDLGQVT